MAQTKFQRLPQNNTWEEPALGFKGILANINPELLPDGYVSDMEKIEKALQEENCILDVQAILAQQGTRFNVNIVPKG